MVKLTWSTRLTTVTAQVNVQDAKTHLSGLLARVEAGEEIVIARGGQPVARLVAIEPVPRRQLGFLAWSVPESFFEPLPEADLADWE